MYHKNDKTTKVDAQDLDLVMPMHNLLERSSNYSDPTDSLWFYSKDEATNFNANIKENNAFTSFKYKVKLLRNTEVDGANGIFKKWKDCCVSK